MTPVNPSKLAVEVLYNQGDDKHPFWLAGSGYLVGGAFVLTAVHNVEGPSGELLVRIDGKEEHLAEVRLRGDQDIADIALLEIMDGYKVASSCHYGKVKRTSPTHI